MLRGVNMDFRTPDFEESLVRREKHAEVMNEVPWLGINFKD